MWTVAVYSGGPVDWHHPKVVEITSFVVDICWCGVTCPVSSTGSAVWTSTVTASSPCTRWSSSMRSRWKRWRCSALRLFHSRTASVRCVMMCTESLPLLPLSGVYWCAHSYLHQVNEVNGGDTVFIRCLGTKEICCPKCHFSSVQNHQFRPKFRPNFEFSSKCSWAIERYLICKRTNIYWFPSPYKEMQHFFRKR